LYNKIAKAELVFPDHLSEDSKSFLSKMLVLNPQTRATASSLLLDPFLAKTSYTPLTSDTHFLSTNESSGGIPSNATAIVSAKRS
jgi:serine/threonine protein kinase